MNLLNIYTILSDLKRSKGFQGINFTNIYIEYMFTSSSIS